MLASVVMGWYTQLYRLLERQRRTVESQLHQQARTRVWARWAVDLFFSPEAQTQATASMAQPTAPRSRPAPRRPLRILTRHKTHRKVRMPQMPKGVGVCLAPLPSPPQAAPVLKPTPTPMAQMLVAHYRASAKRVAEANHKEAARLAQCKLARQDGVWATSREIDGLARALNLSIAVYMPNARGMLELRDIKNPESAERIAVVLDRNHFNPLLNNPQDIEVPYEPVALGLVSVPGDGNCFYHSVKTFVGRDEHMLRDIACSAAEAHNLPFED